MDKMSITLCQFGPKYSKGFFNIYGQYVNNILPWDFRELIFDFPSKTWPVFDQRPTGKRDPPMALFRLIAVVWTSEVVIWFQLVKAQILNLNFTIWLLQWTLFPNKSIDCRFFFVGLYYPYFYRTQVRSLATLVTKLTHSLLLLDLTDVTLAFEDAYSKLLDVV